jgi:ubiquinone/menaquinone biosynthesis C-methylase UbiE
VIMPENPAASHQPENSYVIDAESASEMARLMHQDALITQSMGGVFPERSSLVGVRDLLDIACGPGGWALEVARQYPEIEVTAIDISQTMITYARAQARVRKLTNIQFWVMDALKPLDFLPASFDLVNARLIFGFMTPATWPALLAECRRVLRPGGIVRLTEILDNGVTTSPACERLTALAAEAMRLAGRSFAPEGRHFGTLPMLPRLLRTAGFEQIGLRAHALDFSAGTPLHHSTYQDLAALYRLLQPFLVYTGVVTPDEFETLYQQAMTELLAEDFSGIAIFLTVWGESPAQS